MWNSFWKEEEDATSTKETKVLYICISLSLSLYIYNVYLGVLSLNNDFIMKRQVLERWSLTPSASELESYIHLYQLAVLHANPRMGFVSIS